MIFSAKEIPEHTRQTVNRLADLRRLPQSVLLTGGNSALREKCSAELARAVMCKQLKNGTPCLKCSNCIKIKAGTHPDLIRIIPDKNRKTVSVSQVRELVLDSMYIAPNEAENKVYIFPEAQDLSEIIQNTLLKSIEEPPDFVMFILESEQRESLLPTVVSRCTEFSLGQTTAKRTNSEDTLAQETAAAIGNALVRKTAYGIMSAAAPLNKNRSLIKKTAAALTVLIRDAMVGDTNAVLLSNHPKEATALGVSLSVQKLLSIKRVCDEIQAFAQSNANENLLLSYFTAQLTEIIQ